MCNESCLTFCRDHLTRIDVSGRRVLEIGSTDVNGTPRTSVCALDPAEYVGIDIGHGPGVDIVCSVEDALDRFGPASFDLVISTEMLEHVRQWRTAITNIKRLCRNGGVVLLTTRSYGTPYHGFPYDFWRYELDDMKRIFADFDIEVLEPDPLDSGVFLKARKPVDYSEIDLSEISLYSIVTRTRTRDITDRELYTTRYLLRWLTKQAARTAKAVGVPRDFGIYCARLICRAIEPKNAK